MRIYNIELTNQCNCQCEYCPQPKMKRKKGFMSLQTYMEALEKQEFNFVELHGFGESLLHPNIYDFIKIAHNRGLRTRFSTNGLLLNREVMTKLVDAGLDLLWISIRPFFDKVVETMKELYDEYSKKMTIVFYYVEFQDKAKPLPPHWKVTRINPHSWSGQIALPFKKNNIMCFNLANNAVTVLWDGRVVNCCHDVEGRYIIGTIYDQNLEPKPNELCKGCEFSG